MNFLDCRYAVYSFVVILAFGCSIPEKPIVTYYDGNVPGERSSSVNDQNSVAAAVSSSESDRGQGRNEPGSQTSSNSNNDPDKHPALNNASHEDYVAVPNGNGSSASADQNGSEIAGEKNGGNAQGLLDYALELCEESQKFWAEGNIERSIEYLDQAYSIILKLDPEQNPELVQPIEDLRFTISKRVLEIYASRYTAVNGNHNEIPLVMNKHVEKEIKSFQGNERKFFIESYKRSGRYRDEILKKLKEAGMPEELSWLPLIESGFKVRALSRARALGLWQFIPSTGYKFGLKRDAWIDERLDPDKATEAAIAYMKELHQLFGDWSTVLAAYNCGEMRVLRVIREQKINYLDDFWDLYQRLPRETARYVPRFMATLHILKDPKKYGFDLSGLDDPIPYEIISVEKQIRLKDLSKKAGVSDKELIALNPELRYKTTPPNKYSLRVPAGEGYVLLAEIGEIPKWAPSFTYHRVRKGETLSLIAQKYGTSIRKIVWANNIRKKHFIRVGQKLKIPLKDGAVPQYASKPVLSHDGTYRVKRGDSLWLIAQKFSTTTKKLKKINNLKSTILYVGQRLKVKES
jgi:membrane-bound lytic murein transglycosylase D